MPSLGDPFRHAPRSCTGQTQTLFMVSPSTKSSPLIRFPGFGRPRTPGFVLAPAIVVGAALSLPLAYLVIRSLGTGGELWDLLLRMRMLETIGSTALLTVIVTAASAALALPLAWLTVRTDLPLRGFWSVATALPLVIPSYVGGFAVVTLLGPRGMLQEFIAGPLFGVDRMPDVSGLAGASLTLIMLSYPYVLLTARGALRGLDPSLEEAAQGFGKGKWTRFFQVTAPQLKPALASGSLLVALYTLSDFGAVSLLSFEAFSYVIYLQYDAGARELAAASSLALIVMALAVLTIESASRGRARYHRSGVGAQRSPRPVRLGRWRWPAFGFCTFICAVSLGMPLSVLGYWVAQGLQAGESLGLAWGTTFNSVYVSALAAIAAVVAALPLAVLMVRYAGRLSVLLERLTYVGFALPGIVVALSLVFFTANYLQPLYQNIVILIFAYVVLFLPAAVGAVRASLLQVSPRLEDASRGLGRNGLRTFLRVTLPLALPGVLSGMALVFLITMKELPATLVLGPIGFQTLATSIWSATESAFFARAAGPALLLVLASSVPMAFIVLREGGHHSKA